MSKINTDKEKVGGSGATYSEKYPELKKIHFKGSIDSSEEYKKYLKALDTALREGAKYKDLLQINPQDYGLPISRAKDNFKDQYSSILFALNCAFLPFGIYSLYEAPDLRSIALEIEAPYSVIMDCYNLRING
jgi:hypothetical protein